MYPLYVQPRFFSAPQTGRRIVAGFSYLQRIGKGANTNIWFAKPEQSFPNHIEWGAVRQFELLQEADNLAIDELDLTDHRRAFSTLMKMRGGGYRVTIITLGCYTDRHDADDLHLLDMKIQNEITNLIHFLYLDELSQKGCTLFAKELDEGKWCYAEALPHVALTLKARKLYKPERQNTKEETFFKILDLLSPRHIMHDTAIGLVLPDASKEKNWVYIASRESQFLTFQQTLTTLFENLDQERAVMCHMRGYGDRLGAASLHSPSLAA